MRFAPVGLAIMLGAFGATAAAGCNGSCGSAATTSDGVAEGASSSLPPVDPPAALLAEGTIASPDATLQRLQRGIGGGAGLLPSTLGGIVCALAGLDPRLGPEISGASPAYVALGGELAAAEWVLAARLVEARRARPLYEGTGAIFDARDGGSGITVLTAKAGRTAGEAVAVAPGGWVVVGSSVAAIEELGPYVTRTMPTRTVRAESIAIDVPPAALAGKVADWALRAWSDAERAMLESDRSLRAEHGGRAPDFGDPHAIVGALDGWVQTKIAALRDLRGAHVAVDVRDDGLGGVLTASPASTGGAAAAMIAGLSPGSTEPLARAPKASAVALLLRDDAASRARDAANLETVFAATVGPRLGAADAKRVHAALDDWTGARGDWATFALTVMPPEGPSLVVDVASSDVARTSHGVREGVDALVHVPALHDPFATWLHVRDVSVTSAELAGAGHATVATASRAQASPLGLAWAPRPGDADLALAVAADPLPALGALASPPPGELLGDDPPIRALLARLGNVAGALVSQPGRSPGCVASGGAALAWSASPDAASVSALRLTFDASDASLRCLAKTLF